ncbi:hypothetical protein [Photobacterium minamisatsumaniensis]
MKPLRVLKVIEKKNKVRLEREQGEGFEVDDVISEELLAANKQ